ncbi:hemerythrin domain-containing protein [Lacibacterium aquatile]|uniref:Hemerythrin domain-containing protein n=1 Tax=Lacibacterium aquatile TaxID=1168082 RepID=A0ABW5DWT1_9PROT
MSETPNSFSGNNLSGTGLVGRHDIYGPIHKGLRLAQAGLLTRIGSTDFEDAVATVALLDELKSNLDFFKAHLRHEEEVMHAAVEAKAPGTMARLEEQHDEHRYRFHELEQLIATIEATPARQRAPLGRALYLAFTNYMSEDFAHMREEETVMWPTLCALFTDEELQAQEGQIVSQLSPDEAIFSMRLMIPSMNRVERAIFLAKVKTGAPPQAFNAVIEFAARPTLSAEDFADLSDRLGLAA